MQRVLVRCVNYADVEYTFEGEGEGVINSHKYRRMDFHLVDLDRDELQEFFLPELLLCRSTPGSMVSLGNSAIIVGIDWLTHRDAAAMQALEHSQSQEEQGKHIFYFGGSRYDLSAPEKRWKSIPAPTHSTCNPNCTSLFGKIYIFGPTLVDFPLQVFDPDDNQWIYKTLPLPVNINCEISWPVVPDPCNRRILVHLRDCNRFSPSLYAFYPEGGTDDADGGSWECITPSFVDWSETVTLENGVLYILYSRKHFELCAYDLVNQQWLDIEWSSRLVNVNFSNIEFDAFINLGNGMLCLAYFSLVFPYNDPTYPAKIKVSFIKFKVKRRTSASVICISCLSMHSFTLPSTKAVIDFIPV